MKITKDWLIEQNAPSSLIFLCDRPTVTTKLYHRVSHCYTYPEEAIDWLIKTFYTQKQLARYRSSNFGISDERYLRLTCRVGNFVDSEAVTLCDLQAMSACKPGQWWFQATFGDGSTTVRDLVDRLVDRKPMWLIWLLQQLDPDARLAELYAQTWTPELYRVYSKYLEYPETTLEAIRKGIWRMLPDEERTDHPESLYASEIEYVYCCARPLRRSELKAFITTMLEEYYDHH